MPSPARTLLAIWVIVVATGTVVTHQHVSAPNHTHGFGWTSLSAPLNRSGLPLTHRHFVLLGVELEAIPGEPDGDVPDTTVTTLEFTAPTAVADPGDALPDHDPLLDPLSVPQTFQSSLTFGVTPAESVASCPLISLARSGVLRI